MIPAPLNTSAGGGGGFGSIMKQLQVVVGGDTQLLQDGAMLENETIENKPKQ